MPQSRLNWQSKIVLLLVLPIVTASVVLQIRFFTGVLLPVTIWTLGLSLLFALIVIKVRAGTPAAAFSGAAITASLMFSSSVFPYKPWNTALVPVLAVFLLSFAATRLGRADKQRMGLAEQHRGRAASQVAANLGMAALASESIVQSGLLNVPWLAAVSSNPTLLLSVSLAALTEAAADTVSSEVGQVLGGQPRMITTFRRAEPGTDGAITMAGTAAGIFAAGVVAFLGSFAMRGGPGMIAVSWAAGVFGLFFDSLLGATAERRGWLNNDAVNFLSTLSASTAAALLLAVLPHRAIG